jgi:hypothetical protein
LYSFGKHASLGATDDGTMLSLESLAISSGLSAVPEHASYIRYFAGDPHYANTLVRSALESSVTTDVQRRAQVLGISQYMIVYLAALQAMNEAVGSCKSTGDDRSGDAAVNWDHAAALIIGHLEGSAKSGSTEGRLIWALSKNHCSEFGTCSVEENSSTRTNDKITTNLYIGRGAVLDGSCDELRQATDELSSLLLAPIFQGLFSATSKLAQRNEMDKEMVQSEAYVFAQVLLPLIDDTNQKYAKTIRDNYPLEGRALRSGIVPVANALIHVMNELNVPCQYVGSNTQIDACSGQVSKTKKNSMISGIIVGAVTLAALAFFIIRFRSKRNAKNVHAPVFTVSKGELNHHSEFLCSRTEEPSSPRPGSSDGETDLMHDACDAIVEEEVMGVTQDAILNVYDTDAEYVRAIAAALNDKQIV